MSDRLGTVEGQWNARMACSACFKFALDAICSCHAVHAVLCTDKQPLVKKVQSSCKFFRSASITMPFFFATHKPIASTQKRIGCRISMHQGIKNVPTRTRFTMPATDSMKQTGDRLFEAFNASISFKRTGDGLLTLVYSVLSFPSRKPHCFPKVDVMVCLSRQSSRPLQRI